MRDILNYPLISQKGLHKKHSGPKRKSFGYQVLGFGSGGAKVPVIGRFLLIAGGGGGAQIDSPTGGTAGGGGGGVIYMANSPNAGDAVFFVGANPVVVGAGGAGAGPGTAPARGDDSTINLTAALSAGGGGRYSTPNVPNFSSTGQGGSGSGSQRGDGAGGS